MEAAQLYEAAAPLLTILYHEWTEIEHLRCQNRSLLLALCAVIAASAYISGEYDHTKLIYKLGPLGTHFLI